MYNPLKLYNLHPTVFNNIFVFNSTHDCLLTTIKH